MQIDIEKRCWIFVGRDLMHDAWVGIFFGFGYREDAKPGEIVWRHYWSWSSRSLPRFIWDGWRIIGYRAFGYNRVWR